MNGNNSTVSKRRASASSSAATVFHPKSVEDGAALLSITGIANRYGVNPITIRRRIEDRKHHFPKPDIMVGRRRYWWEKTIRAFELASVTVAEAEANKGDQDSSSRQDPSTGAD